MQLTHHHSDQSPDGLLLAWKVIAGLALTVAVLFLGTAVVESVLPDLPDQARAGAAVRPSELGIGGVVSRADQPAPVEHFHAQFNLRAGTDTQGPIETF